jgi:hypothetical protein
VLASILARDYGMFLVAVLGVFSYLGVAAVCLGGKAVAQGRYGKREMITGKD